MAVTKKKTAPKVAPSKPATALPEWSNSTAIANLLGKTTRRVQQLTAEGVLETHVPPVGGKRKYKTCDTVQCYIAHVEKKAQESGESGQLAELNLKKLEAEVTLKESQGQLHQLKTEIQKGKYLPADQAAEELLEFLVTFRKFALAIPPRMAGIMAATTDTAIVREMERDMRKEVETMLGAFVDAAQEKQAAVE